tara:strand:+ start:46 stop:1230 length:1185 start_codon:yes stop_codon:yes gene_type:complete
MKLSHLVTISLIFFVTSCAWWLLGSTIIMRTNHVRSSTSYGVADRWGPALTQTHPWASYTSSSGGKVKVQPTSSDVSASLAYQPVKMGLLWHRTYGVLFEGHYIFTNATAITQTFDLALQLPTTKGMLDNVSVMLGEGEKARLSLATPEEGLINERAELAPGQSVPVRVSYVCRGTDVWRYGFLDGSRIRDFKITVRTDFKGVNFPVSSPTSRDFADKGLELIWKYDDAISAPDVAVEMPVELNAGPVAAQIAMWSPLSLLLFLGVIVMTVVVRSIRLHPINYLFLCAGFFSFPLLFSYMLDVFPVYVSFTIAAAISVGLVCGYLRAASGQFMFSIALPAQIAYMVLFSGSFFFQGLTGLTLTVGGIATLAVLMTLTAKVDWSERLGDLSPKLA